MDDVPKYIIIFHKGTKTLPDVGNLTDVRVGDSVSYKDENGAHATSKVAKVNVKAQVLRTEPSKYKDYVLRSACTLKFDKIDKLERPNPQHPSFAHLQPNVLDMFTEPPVLPDYLKPKPLEPFVPSTDSKSGKKSKTKKVKG